MLVSRIQNAMQLYDISQVSIAVLDKIEAIKKKPHTHICKQSVFI